MGILSKLKGGDLRSIGKSDEVVRDVLKTPALVSDLFDGLLDTDPVVRLRAADALEKVTRDRPELLQSRKVQLLSVASASVEKELRWHLAQMLPRLKLTPSEQMAVVNILLEYLEDKSSIVKTFSMQALADLAARDERLSEQVRPLIERLTRTGTPAMKSRGRKLLKQFG